MKLFRWISFFPTLILAFSLITIIGEFIYRSMLGATYKTEASTYFMLYHCIEYFLCSFLGIVVSCLIAPKARVRISIIYFNFGCLTLLSMLNGINFTNKSVWYYVVAWLFFIIGGMAAVLRLKYLEKQSIFKFSKTSIGFILFSVIWIICDLIIFIFSPKEYMNAYSYSGTISILICLIYIVFALITHFKNLKTTKKKSNMITLP